MTFPEAYPGTIDERFGTSMGRSNLGRNEEGGKKKSGLNRRHESKIESGS